MRLLTTATIAIIALAGLPALAGAQPAPPTNFMTDADTNGDKAVDYYEHSQWLKQISGVPGSTTGDDGSAMVERPWITAKSDSIGCPGAEKCIPPQNLETAGVRYGTKFLTSNAPSQLYNDRMVAFGQADADRNGKLEPGEAEAYLGIGMGCDPEACADEGRGPSASSRP